ncbi:hypothetical protein PQR02_39755 [Paraburkholderia sediminicola]|uniref:Uncharacterized protein n=1 Tax=Paraburkholderia rhynchosiae TaxID=487049 RepID=A0ACC7NQC9_9BURK
MRSNPSIDSSPDTVEMVSPWLESVSELVSGFAAWWALNLHTANSIIAASQSLAAGAGRGVAPSHLCTLIPSFAVSIAKEFQRYLRQTLQIVEDTQQAVVAAASPLIHDIEHSATALWRAFA